MQSPQMTNLIGVFGAGGFGREVIPLLDEQISVTSQFPKSARIVFVVDEVNSVKDVNGYEIMTFNDFCAHESDSKQITIAVGDSSARKKIYERVCQKSIPLITVTAVDSVRLQSVDIDEGAILCPYTTITSNVKIGKCFHANNTVMLRMTVLLATLSHSLQASSAMEMLSLKTMCILGQEQLSSRAREAGHLSSAKAQRLRRDHT